jgi:hypothetical protein
MSDNGMSQIWKLAAKERDIKALKEENAKLVNAVLSGGGGDNAAIKIEIVALRKAMDLAMKLIGDALGSPAPDPAEAIEQLRAEAEPVLAGREWTPIDPAEAMRAKCEDCGYDRPCGRDCPNYVEQTAPPAPDPAEAMRAKALAFIELQWRGR